MNQPSLFGVPDTVPSPICCYDGKCPKHGRAVLGAPVTVGVTTVSREVICLTCGRTGVQSENLAAKGKVA